MYPFTLVESLYFYMQVVGREIDIDNISEELEWGFDGDFEGWLKEQNLEQDYKEWIEKNKLEKCLIND